MSPSKTCDANTTLVGSSDERVRERERELERELEREQSEQNKSTSIGGDAKSYLNQRRRIKSQASIVSFGSSSQKLRPLDHENDKFLKRFAVNNEEINEDNIKYHSLCFGM